MPAGTLATTSEDRILAVHHTSPASLMAHVCLCSLSLRQLPVYSYSFTQLHHMIHNNCYFFSGIHKHEDSFTLFLQVENELHFCERKNNIVRYKRKKMHFSRNNNKTEILFYIIKSGILSNLPAGRGRWRIPLVKRNLILWPTCRRLTMILITVWFQIRTSSES